MKEEAKIALASDQPSRQPPYSGACQTELDQLIGSYEKIANISVRKAFLRLAVSLAAEQNIPKISKD